MVLAVAALRQPMALAVAAAGGDAMTPPKHWMRKAMKETWIRALALAIAFTATMTLVGSPGALAGDAARKVRATDNIVQLGFESPEAAAQALQAAMKSDNWKQIYAVLGPGSGKLIYTGDKVVDSQTRTTFVAAYDQSVKFDRQGDAKATLLLGDNGYPFPFPIVKGASGWTFDSRAGAEEIVNRRIGENELAAIQVCLAYVDAQREYATKDRDSNGLLEYAPRFVSTPGKRDGLYWPTQEGEPPSPFGPVATRAAVEGYGMDIGVPQAFHGYHYRILTAQGRFAQGGAYDYRVKGRMIGGFALIAYPARWGVSGVMSFICNHDGVVYEKNLGRDTAAQARAMTRFDPDPSWVKAETTP
jgi:hypothetical protein